MLKQILFVVAVTIGTSLGAEDSLLKPETLRGISSVRLNTSISIERDIALRLGFRETDIENDVESILKSRGLTVEPGADAVFQLSITISDMSRFRAGSAVAVVTSGIHQLALLERNQDVETLIPTHQRQQRYIGAISDINRDMRSEIERIVTTIASDISTANFGRLGNRIVANYINATPQQQKPFPGDGSKCYVVAHERINNAVKQICGSSQALPSLDAFKTFDRLFGSKIDPKSTWLQIDQEFRGKGGAGAMAFLGLGKLIDESEIWEGKLEPGAVLQTWKKDADFTRVRDGETPTDIGHSMIFLNYVRSATGTITGMKAADQGSGWDSPNVLSRSEFEYWIGANLQCNPNP